MRKGEAKTALSERDVERELLAITNVWKTLQPLDSEARQRVIQWAAHWMHQERGDDPDVY